EGRRHLPLLARERTERALAEQARVADERVQGRTQVVRHRGERRALEAGHLGETPTVARVGERDAGEPGERLAEPEVLVRRPGAPAAPRKSASRCTSRSASASGSPVPSSSSRCRSRNWPTRTPSRSEPPPWGGAALAERFSCCLTSAAGCRPRPRGRQYTRRN